MKKIIVLLLLIVAKDCYAQIDYSRVKIIFKQDIKGTEAYDFLNHRKLPDVRYLRKGDYIFFKFNNKIIPFNEVYKQTSLKRKVRKLVRKDYFNNKIKPLRMRIGYVGFIENRKYVYHIREKGYGKAEFELITLNDDYMAELSNLSRRRDQENEEYERKAKERRKQNTIIAAGTVLLGAKVLGNVVQGVGKALVKSNTGSSGNYSYSQSSSTKPMKSKINNECEIIWEKIDHNKYQAYYVWVKNGKVHLLPPSVKVYYRPKEYGYKEGYYHLDILDSYIGKKGDVNNYLRNKYCR